MSSSSIQKRHVTTSTMATRTSSASLQIPEGGGETANQNQNQNQNHHRRRSNQNKKNKSKSKNKNLRNTAINLGIFFMATIIGWKIMKWTRQTILASVLQHPSSNHHAMMTPPSRKKKGKKPPTSTLSRKLSLADMESQNVLSSSSPAAPLFTYQNNDPSFPHCDKNDDVVVDNETIDFTLVTQLSQERLWMMEHHCQRYPHSISIAVYTNASLAQTILDLENMGCHPYPSIGKSSSVSGASGASLSSSSFPQVPHVTVAVMHPETLGFGPEDYPVNHLRNLAISNVQTTHFIYIDVDFFVPNTLYDLLHNQNEFNNNNNNVTEATTTTTATTTRTTTIKQALQEDSKLALVLPAFMLFRQCTNYQDCRDANLQHMPHTQQDLLQMMIEKRGHVFDPTNMGGHGSTLYKEWIRQSPGTVLDIPCLKSHRYEPFIIVRKCRSLPPFPEAFTGYGKNKLAWFMLLTQLGYTFAQVGGAYLCHYPHLDSQARTHWNEAPSVLQVPIPVPGHDKNSNHDEEDNHDTTTESKQKTTKETKKKKKFQIRRPKPSDGNLQLHQYKRGQVDQLFVQYKEWLRHDSGIPADMSRMPMCDQAQDDDSKLWIDHNNNNINPEDTISTSQKEQHELDVGVQEDERLIIE